MEAACPCAEDVQRTEEFPSPESKTQTKDNLPAQTKTNNSKNNCDMENEKCNVQIDHGCHTNHDSNCDTRKADQFISKEDETVLISRREIAWIMEEAVRADALSRCALSFVQGNSPEYQRSHGAIPQMHDFESKESSEKKVFQFDQQFLGLTAGCPVFKSSSHQTKGLRLHDKGEQCANQRHSIELQTDRKSDMAGSHDSAGAADSYPSSVSVDDIVNFGAASSEYVNYPRTHNIPACLFDSASYYSTAMSEQEELAVLPGVPQERHGLAMDELVKMKLFLHKITSEGGVHPDNLKELVDLREQVLKLKTENDQLRVELDNRPLPAPNRVPETFLMLHKENAQLHDELKNKKKMIDHLSEMFGKIHAENQKMKELEPHTKNVTDKPIPKVSTCTAKIDNGSQTDSESTQGLQQEHAKLHAQIDEAKVALGDALTAKEEALSCLTNEKQEIENLNQQLQIKSTHCDELDIKIFRLNEEREKLNRAQVLATESFERLKEIIDSERKSWAMDEKKFLHQNKKDSKTIKRSAELMIEVDKLQVGVPPELKQAVRQYIASLRESRGPRSTSTSVSSSSS